MQSIPTSFNPSDYQFLLKSIIEGNIVSKAESLKRLNTLVSTDKKQFSIYAKRVVLAIQQLLLQPKQDINLLASTLALEIINLNPREIEYYIRTKLLKNMVRNLGDAKPQIRKTSHYCLLGYVKTYKTFDQVIQVYINYGFNSESWQLRQKSINSFQSILITEMKYLNWSSIEFKKVVEQLLNRTKDQSQYAQKASEQCLLSICRYEELRNFSKKLSNSVYNALKHFCDYMHSQGFLQQVKLYIPEAPPVLLAKNNSTMSMVNEKKPVLEKGYSLNVLDKPDPNQPQSIIPRQNIINKMEELRRKSQTPVAQQKKMREQKMEADKSIDEQKSYRLKKTESVGAVPKKTRQVQLPSIKKSINIDRRADSDIKIQLKQQKPEIALGRKLIDDLRNQKDWKIRLDAIEQLQNKFITNKDKTEAQNLTKTFLPILIKMLADPNFKVALISLKIIESILDVESVNYATLIPQLVDKISDGKVALRQNISKLIRKQFLRTSNKAWINELLGQLRKSPPPNSNIKQQILNILSKITIESSQNSDGNVKIKRMQSIQSCLSNIIDSLCPLMEDLKTKIKIKTLDLLIMLSIKTQKIQYIKQILANKLNQVYFEMYVEKISKEMKIHGILEHAPDRGSTSGGRRDRAGDKSMILPNRRIRNIGNTTSTSLKKYTSVEDHNTTARTASFLDKKKPNDSERDKQFDEISIQNAQKDVSSPTKNNVMKSYRKKTFDYKSTQYSAFSTGPTLAPFNDPEKELKTILNEIKSQQWQTCSEALTKLRRIIQNHDQLLTHSILRLLTPEIMRLVESLRSSLSKNAVITLHDLSNKVKKMLDTELDSIFSKLLKKSLDANSFISEEVRRALVSVCSNCNENRVISLLANSHTSRAVPVKISIANVLQSITFLPKVYEKQLQRVVGILVNFMGEGSLQIREKAKSLLSSILQSQKGSQVMRLIPSEHLNKLKIKQLKKQNAEQPQVNNVNTENPQQFFPLKKKKKQKITVFPQQFDALESLLEQCQSSDWKMRQKNMSTIHQTIVEVYPRQLAQHRLAGRVMDVLSKQIGDPNVKVASNALRILQTMPGKNQDLIEHNLSVLTNQIFNCFGSHKPEIKKLSEDLFESIAQNIQKWMLVQHMCNGALYGLQKSRPIILKKLSEILPSVYGKGNKKTLINKNVYPLINKIAQENKPQNLQGLTILLQTCNESTNGQFLTSLKPKAIHVFNSL